MLELKNITKRYITGDMCVDALKGVDLKFRKSEFVSILGQSGCGKTTLLNIIGGLDKYTTGDLIINGRSTKQFKDGDWDVYRNHSIGFVFQSYNLISHQSVLANVELALTLNGISREERRKRATDALVEVGLGDQINKKPNQLSGGQMQRVAIARALVNNPDILLADEPTGALDTQTSVQIMELLKGVSRNRLVIMVTHNPELAEEYSTRIVKLSDGLLVDDSNPVTDEEYEHLLINDKRKARKLEKNKKAYKKSQKKKSMSFATAISLSLKNLMTKKGRTVLTSIAGSIGIVGIALILSLSNGIQIFIDQVQEDALSAYPLSIQRESQDMDALLGAMTQASKEIENTDPNKIYVDDSLDTMVSALTSTVKNDLVSFKKYLDENYDSIKDYVSDIQYTYDFNMQIYNISSEHGLTQVGLASMLDNMGESFSGMSTMFESSGMSGMDVFSEMINNQELLDQQYEIVRGNWPTQANEVVLVVGKNNQISKMTLYMLGYYSQAGLEDIMATIMTPGSQYDPEPSEPIDMDELMNMTFTLVNTSDFYQKTNEAYAGTWEGETPKKWTDIREKPEYKVDEDKLADYIQSKGLELKISGIIRPKVDATSTSISGVLGYTKGLTDYILEQNTGSEIIKQQKKYPEYNVTTGLKFERTQYTPETLHELIEKIDPATMNTFYSLMTKMILEDPEFSSRLDVKDKESFSQIFMMIPVEGRLHLMSQMLKAVNTEENAAGIATIFSAISQMSPGVTISPDNVATLLPIMSAEQQYVLIAGLPASEQIPMPIPGLADLIGETGMSGIYTETTKMLKGMTVNEEIFLAILSTMKAEDEDFITLTDTLYQFAPQIDETYESVLKELGDAEKADPASINFYAKDFASKEKIEEFIKTYNDSQQDEAKKIQYSDLIGTLLSSVSIIIDVISYVLIAFVSISLVVSSIMIGIITNISVLERTKEIGILRAIGASKKDISRVFNAETFIVGLIAGIFGIAFTLVLCLPINIIVQALSGFNNIRAVLPPLAAVILIAISMLLTIFAGLIPAKRASKKDPVVALRTE